MDIIVESHGNLKKVVLSFSTKKKLNFFLIIALIPIISLFLIFIMFPNIDSLISFVFEDIFVLVAILFLMFIIFGSLFSYGSKIFKKIEFLTINNQNRQIIRGDDVFDVPSTSKIVFRIKHDRLTTAGPLVQIDLEYNEEKQMIAFGTINQRAWIKKIAEVICKDLGIPLEDITNGGRVGGKIIPR